MFCSKCGSSVGDDDLYCKQCGNNLNDDPKPEPAENAEITENAETAEVTEDVESAEVNDTVLPESVSDEEAPADSITSASDAEEAVEVPYGEGNIGSDSASATVGETVPETEIVSDEMHQPAESIEATSTEPKEQPKSNNVYAKKRKPKRRIGAHIISVFLSIILAVFVIITVAVAVLQNVILPDTLTGMFTNVDLEEIKVEDVADKEQLEDLGLKCDSDNVMDIIYDNIDQTNLADPLTKDEFQEIVSNEEFAEFIAENLGENLEAALSGKSAELLTAKDICDFIDKEKDVIEDVIGYEITEERIENLELTLEDSYGEVFDSLKIEDLGDTVGKTTAAAVSIVFSDWLLISLIIFDSLLALLMFVLLHSFRFGFGYCGTVLTIVGMLYTVVSLVAMFGTTTFLFDGVIFEIITQLLSVVLWRLMIISCSILLAGIMMIIIAKIIKSVQKRKLQRVTA